jgi:dTDP-4-amino-4,6-dideoxygalactose transaminase
MIPLIKPRPPRLSEASALLRQIEESGLFSNFGPVNTLFEDSLVEAMFGGQGRCLTVCNATIGLMLAVAHVTGNRTPRQIFALMPSFTFAAAAQAALWCGLTPLFCDIDPENWAASAEAEEDLLCRYRDQIAVVMPYATFGYDIDLGRYARLQARSGIPVVVDAAASLGTLSACGQGFGAGFQGAVVYSMHATKSFATGEGGVIYSADEALVARLRAMSNFGFGEPRMATMPGLNAKLSEVGALLAWLKLQGYDSVVASRGAIVQRYRETLPGLQFQAAAPQRQVHQFAPALLPRALAPLRDVLQARLKTSGIGMATYFSPHVAEQPYFTGKSRAGSLDITRDIAARIISLPVYDEMTLADADEVADRLGTAICALQQKSAHLSRARRRGYFAVSAPKLATGAHQKNAAKAKAATVAAE